MAQPTDITYEYREGNPASWGENDQTFHLTKEIIRAAALPNVYQQFAASRSIPQNSGKEWRVHRWFNSFDRKLSDPEFASKGFISSRNFDNLATKFTQRALAEGSDGNVGEKATSITLTTQLKKFGNSIDFTEENNIFAADGKVVNMFFMTDFAREAGLLYEDLLQADLLSTSNVMYAGDATSMETLGKSTTADGLLDDLYVIDYEAIRQIVQKLKRNRCPKNTSTVSPSPKLASKPIAPCYYAIIGPEVAHNVREIYQNPATKLNGFSNKPSFIPVQYYSAATSIAEGEIGRIGDLAFIESETQTVYDGKGATVPSNYKGDLIYDLKTNKFNVYPIIIPTKESFATVSLKGYEKFSLHYHSNTNYDSMNRQGARGFISYKMFYASIILREERLLKVLTLAKYNNY